MTAPQTVSTSVLDIDPSATICQRLPDSAARRTIDNKAGLPTETPAYQLGKRLFDIVFAMLLLPLVLGLMAFISLALCLSSGWPIIYRQERIGRHGRSFTMYKFRTMHPDGERILCAHFELKPEARLEWRDTHKLRHDPRIIPLGNILRRTSLDELPQILNVLVGNMSLVGPRPIVREELDKYAAKLPYYLASKPGITGLWQISGRCNLPYETRVLLDELYVRRWSMRDDFRIIFQTPRAIVGRTGAY